MKKETEERIKNILADYNPVVEPGEESMTFEEAGRLIETLIKMGRTEEEAFDCLKYCTVGRNYKERESLDDRLNDLSEQIEENCFLAKMAMKKAGHAGFMLLSLNILNRAREKGEHVKLGKFLFGFFAGVFLFDDVLTIIHEIKPVKGNK